MVNSGVDLFAVGKVLGHVSYQSTQRYAHLANATLLAAVEAGAAKQKVASAARSTAPSADTGWGKYFLIFSRNTT